MIRFIGERDGKRMVGFILEPGNLARLTTTGDPIVVELASMIPELGQLEIMIGYAENVEAMRKTMIDQALADGAEVHVVSSEPERTQ